MSPCCGLDVADFLDDGVADDAGCDGEYGEEHGKSPLLRFVAREFPGHTPKSKTRAKRRMPFFCKNRRVEKLD